MHKKDSNLVICNSIYLLCLTISFGGFFLAVLFFFLFSLFVILTALISVLIFFVVLNFLFGIRLKF